MKTNLRRRSFNSCYLRRAELAARSIRTFESLKANHERNGDMEAAKRIAQEIESLRKHLPAA